MFSSRRKIVSQITRNRLKFFVWGVGTSARVSLRRGAGPVPGNAPGGASNRYQKEGAVTFHEKCFHCAVPRRRRGGYPVDPRGGRWRRSWGAACACRWWPQVSLRGVGSDTFHRSLLSARMGYLRDEADGAKTIFLPFGVRARMTRTRSEIDVCIGREAYRGCSFRIWHRICC